MLRRAECPPHKERRVEFMKKLIVTEKPSVGAAIGKVLRAFKRQDGYIENDEYIISWCVGHLIKAEAPDAYDESLRKWSIESLPIVPDKWKYQIISGTSKQYRILKKLMNSREVSEIICATDAGREGELIFRLVYNEAGCKKPFKRLWISSMEEAAIKEGFENLRDGSEFDNLYYAALARSKADWLVGINATRLYSCKHNITLNIGRVQTPVLAMIAERDKEVSNFKAKEYYTAVIDCGSFTAETDRIEKSYNAETAAQTCAGQTAKVKDISTKHGTSAPPKLFDLTALQREANRIYGYTAKQTLDYAQSLYERRLITYPRTDSRYITTDVEDSIEELAQIAADKLDIEVEFDIEPSVLSDNSKVSDHHALLPTKTLDRTDIATIPNGERSILILICRQLICALAEEHRYDTVKAEIECEGMSFFASGKTVTQNGWKEYAETRSDKSSSDNALAPMSVGDTFENVKASVKTHKTAPPKLYTEDTLLAAMENAVKAENIERCGLGTPATRAGVIEHLVTRGFVERRGKKLTATDKGRNLVRRVPAEIKSPDMTAAWEEKLTGIAEGKLTEHEFVNEVVDFLTGLINAEKEA